MVLSCRVVTWALALSICVSLGASVRLELPQYWDLIRKCPEDFQNIGKVVRPQVFRGIASPGRRPATHRGFASGEHTSAFLVSVEIAVQRYPLPPPPTKREPSLASAMYDFFLSIWSPVQHNSSPSDASDNVQWYTAPTGDVTEEMIEGMIRFIASTNWSVAQRFRWNSLLYPEEWLARLSMGYEYKLLKLTIPAVARIPIEKWLIGGWLYTEPTGMEMQYFDSSFNGAKVSEVIEIQLRTDFPSRGFQTFPAKLLSDTLTWTDDQVELYRANMIALEHVPRPSREGERKRALLQPRGLTRQNLATLSDLSFEDQVIIRHILPYILSPDDYLDQVLGFNGCLSEELRPREEWADLGNQ